MSRSKTYLYKPSSDYWKSYVQFEFLNFVEGKDIGFYQQLREIYEKWRREIMMQVYKIIEPKLETEDIKIFSFDDFVYVSLLMPDSRYIETEFDEPTHAEMEKKTWKPNEGISIDRVAYKYKLEDNKLLESVNLWAEKWNLETKDWLYRWVVLRFQLWAEGITDSQSLYEIYVLNPKIEFKLDFPPPIFNFFAFNPGRFSLQEYEKQIRRAFEWNLTEYFSQIKTEAREKGYRNGRQRELMRDIEWGFYSIIKKRSDAEIAEMFTDDPRKSISFETVKTAVRRLKQHF